MDNPVASPSWPANKFRKSFELFVPDCLVVDILSWLGAKKLIQCRCVCKSWRDLLSTPEFMGLHKQRGGGGIGGNNLHMLLVDEPEIRPRIKHFFSDEWQFRMKPIVRHIDRHPSHRTEFSQEGFLVMYSICSHSILIDNPIENHGVKILCPSDFFCINLVYGIYFNPILQQQCVLIGEHNDGNYLHGSSIRFRMLVLEAEPRWRYLNNPIINYKPKFQMLSMQWAPSVLVGDYLYWLVVPIAKPDGTINKSSSSDYIDVMEFNVRSEEFTLIQHVRDATSSSEITLLNIDGFLSAVQISVRASNVEIDIRTLKDRVELSWTSSKYRVGMGSIPFGWFKKFRPIAVEYEEIIFQSSTAIFACNFKGNTTKIHKQHTKSRFFGHSLSPLSLKKCKTVVCTEGVDEKKYTERCKVCSELFNEETPNTGVNNNSDVLEDLTTTYREDGGRVGVSGPIAPEISNPTSVLGRFIDYQN